MLENNYSPEVSELLDTLPCEVKIPHEWGDFFAKQGMIPSVENDLRRSARKHFPAKAILEIKTTLPAIRRQQLVHAVYTRNISRDGISFLHSEQLFPGEGGRLWLEDRRLVIEVVRCVRINAKCWEAGCILKR